MIAIFTCPLVSGLSIWVRLMDFLSWESLGAFKEVFGILGDIMKNRLALPGAIANHAGQMADAAALIAPAFKKDLSEGRTDAKAEIWQDWAKFESAIAKYEEAARGLAIAASGADPSAVGPAMRALGKSCGGCHKPFRKAKEDSFKKK